MEVVLLVLVFTSLLREGMPLFTGLLLSSDTMTWNDAGKYCQKNNGRLIVLDSQKKWDDFTSQNMDTSYSTNQAYWTGMRFNDTITCRDWEDYIPWNYNGWGNWYDRYNEPNRCPTEQCIRLQYNAMHTTDCALLQRALCEIESSESITSTTSDPTTPPTTEAADVKSVVSSTTPNTPESDVSFTVPSTTLTTEAADVKSAVSSTTPNIPESDVSSTVPSTTPTTETTDVKAAVSSTTSNTPESDVSSTVPSTTPTTETTDVKAAVSSTTPNTSGANETSSDPTTTDATGNAATTATPLPSGEGNTTCNQCCVKANQTRQLDEHEREEIIHTLRVQLAVNKTNLSAQRRKFISVYDSRPSSVAIGGLACAILAAIVGVFVVPDSISLGIFVYKPFQTQHKTLPI